MSAMACEAGGVGQRTVDEQQELGALDVIVGVGEPAFCLVAETFRCCVELHKLLGQGRAVRDADPIDDRRCRRTGEIGTVASKLDRAESRQSNVCEWLAHKAYLLTRETDTLVMNSISAHDIDHARMFLSDALQGLLTSRHVEEQILSLAEVLSVLLLRFDRAESDSP